MFFLQTDIDTIYDRNDLPNQDLLCDEYQEYDGKSLRLNIVPTDTCQHIRQIIRNKFCKAVNLVFEYKQIAV